MAGTSIALMRIGFFAALTHCYYGVGRTYSVQSELIAHPLAKPKEKSCLTTSILQLVIRCQTSFPMSGLRNLEVKEG